MARRARSALGRVCRSRLLSHRGCGLLRVACPDGRACCRLAAGSHTRRNRPSGDWVRQSSIQKCAKSTSEHAPNRH